VVALPSAWQEDLLMHISFGAVILILGLLFLATSRAGLKVLGVLFVVGVAGAGALLYQDHLTALAQQ
jgi:hypothetical protein